MIQHDCIAAVYFNIVLKAQSGRSSRDLSKFQKNRHENAAERNINVTRDTFW